MKITKRQLRKIIKEAEGESPYSPPQPGEQGSADPETTDLVVLDRLKDGLMYIALDRIVNKDDIWFEDEVIKFILDSSTATNDQVEDAIHILAKQNNLI